MYTMGSFYKQTWWLWLLFVVVFALLTVYVQPIFVLMIPGILGYSIYFGIVRTTEIREEEAAKRRKAAEAKPQG